MNQLLRAGVVFALAWYGISSFRRALDQIEEEELARHGAGESDFQKHKTDKPKKSAKKEE